MTAEEQDSLMIRKVKDLMQVAGFSGGVQAWVNSYNDTMPNIDVIHAIDHMADHYDRDSALFHIANLMDMYAIKEADIKHYLEELKKTGWPYRKR